MLKPNTKTKKERRIDSRISKISNLNLEVYVRIVPHCRLEVFHAILENISIGGMALRFKNVKPDLGFIYLQVILPNKLCIACHTEIKYVKKAGSDEFIVGTKFIDLPNELKDHLNFMARDYTECEKRMVRLKKNYCISNCMASPICTKPDKNPGHN